jgi:hypothetical protein
VPDWVSAEGARMLAEALREQASCAVIAFSY